MTGAEIAWGVVALVALLAGCWQLAKWAAYWLERVCNCIEQRSLARHVANVRNALMPGRPIPLVHGTMRVPVNLIEQPVLPELVITFWNGVSMTIDRSRELDRLALVSGLLLRFHWHARPSA